MQFGPGILISLVSLVGQADARQGLDTVNQVVNDQETD